MIKGLLLYKSVNWFPQKYFGYFINWESDATPEASSKKNKDAFKNLYSLSEGVVTLVLSHLSPFLYIEILGWK